MYNNQGYNNYVNGPGNFGQNYNNINCNPNMGFNPNMVNNQPPIPFGGGNLNRIFLLILEIIANGQKFAGNSKKTL